MMHIQGLMTKALEIELQMLGGELINVTAIANVLPSIEYSSPPPLDPAQNQRLPTQTLGLAVKKGPGLRLLKQVFPMSLAVS